MSCCEKKRQGLNSLSSGPSKKVGVDGEEAPVSVGGSAAAQTGARFRYTGIGSLEVDGTLSRRVYRFSTGTPELMVVAEDVAVLRGYSELVEVKG